MPPIKVRNKHGDLTCEALDAGYEEQAAWTTVGMERHEVVLKLDEHDPAIAAKNGKPIRFEVVHSVIHPLEEYPSRGTAYGFTTLTEARECFKKESTH